MVVRQDLPLRALVTGGNRGLGFALCRQLRDAGCEVILAARAPHDAARELGVRALELDVLHPNAFPEPVDVLVNNAAIMLDTFDEATIERTFATNLLGPRRVLHACSLAAGARVVMVSSGMGELSSFDDAVRARFLACQAVDEVDALAAAFLDAVRHNEHQKTGWHGSAYGVSKALLNAYTRVLAAEHPSWRVNAVCPGWVRTDMGGPAAPRDVETGASSIAWAALLDAEGPTGGFFRDGRAIPW